MHPDDDEPIVILTDDAEALGAGPAPQAQVSRLAAHGRPRIMGWDGGRVVMRHPRRSAPASHPAR